jgi:diaminohydroxyphosphoribosylaminopyrimidine deaminase / 5-amino-6-(5-phosphoribosylamino)uracil reductase
MDGAERHMRRALELAEQALFLTAPNPRVGCVLVATDGHLVGEGHTQQAGGPHAEVMALRDAARRNLSTQGATAYVTLEPCAHTGRTGPCADELIRAGITRVFAAVQDPNPLVAGQGFVKLRAAGVEVHWGPCAAQAKELNIGFFSRMVRKRPWVRMKIAATLDGKTALPNGVSQWITSAQARHDGHAWRARSCAILTGAGTVLADHPTLNVREVDTPRQPNLVLVDSRLDVPPDAPVFGVPGRICTVFATTPDAAKSAALAARNVHVVAQRQSSGDKVDLVAMMDALGNQHINELHVEAGHKLNASLIRAGLVDELLLYYAPRWMGQGQPMADIGPFEVLSAIPALSIQSVQQLGPDLRVLSRLHGRDAFLAA